jgi:Tol biopolymer transport system component
MMKVIDASRVSMGVLSVLLSIAIIVTGCGRKTDLELGIAALDKGDYGKAVETLRKALAKDSMDPEVHYHICRAYAYLDSTDLVLSHYLKLVDLGSAHKDDRELRQLAAIMVGIEPFPSSIVPMRRLNQFKGAFGPLGDRIAVAAAKTDKADIYLGTLDAKNMKKIVSGGMNTDPDFAADGTSLVFVSNRDGDEDLYLYNVTTDETRRLTDNTAQDFAPCFAPDGREIVFVSNLDNPYKWEIYGISVESGRTRRLTNNNYWDGFPRFTANGRSIVFSSKRNGSEDIYVMRRDGGSQEVLFASPADDNDPTLIEENLFFKSQMDGEWEIYQYNIRTQRLIRLTNNQWPDWNPQVSSDGMKMLVSRKIKGRWVLYFINLGDPVGAEVIAAQISKRLSE